MKVLAEKKSKGWGVVQLRSVVAPPLMNGDVGDDYLCGDCGVVLVASWPGTVRIENLDLTCPGCGALNALKLGQSP